MVLSARPFGLSVPLRYRTVPDCIPGNNVRLFQRPSHENAAWVPYGRCSDVQKGR
jgi:hypothetical protein